MVENRRRTFPYGKSYTFLYIYGNVYDFFPNVRCSDRHYCRVSKASDMSNVAANWGMSHGCLWLIPLRPPSLNNYHHLSVRKIVCQNAYMETRSRHDLIVSVSVYMRTALKINIYKYCYITGNILLLFELI